MNENLYPITYMIENDEKNVMIKLRDKNSNMWAVELSGHVLSKSKLDFVYEPSNSFYTYNEDTRFANPEQAYEFYLKHLKRFF